MLSQLGDRPREVAPSGQIPRLGDTHEQIAFQSASQGLGTRVGVLEARGVHVV